MNHHQLPTDKSTRLSKDAPKGDFSKKRKEKKISGESSLAEKPKVGRTSDKKPSNKKIDGEKFLSKMKHIKGVNEWYGSEELSEKEKVEIRISGEGNLADHIVTEIEKVINMTQGNVTVYHNDVKIM
jgi:hypothetical protein